MFSSGYLKFENFNRHLGGNVKAAGSQVAKVKAVLSVLMPFETFKSF